MLTESFFRHTQQLRQPRIREAFAFQTINTVRIQRLQAALRHRGFFFDQIFDLYQEPGINRGMLIHFIHAHAGTEGITHIPDTLRTWRTQFRNNFIFGAGVDCQDDRLEVQLVAFGRNRRRWVIDYKVIPHHIGDDEGRAALNALKSPCEVDLYTDSAYVKDGISKWIFGWKKNGWKTADRKPVKNAELWQQLEEARNRHKVTLHWVKGHAGHPENERADELAREGMAPFKK